MKDTGTAEIPAKVLDQLVTDRQELKTLKADLERVLEALRQKRSAEEVLAEMIIDDTP